MRDRALTEDRDRIARDLHDSVIQRLFAIGLSLQGTARLVERPEAVMRIGEAIDKLDETIRQLRKAIFDIELTINKEGLHPKVLDLVHELRPVLGLLPQVSFSGPVDTVVGDSLVEEVLAVLREALTNVGKHAHASQVVITIAAGEELRLVVADDGVGIGDANAAGLGLKNLRQRAERLGGDVELGTSREGGHAADLARAARVRRRGSRPHGLSAGVPARRLDTHETHNFRNHTQLSRKFLKVRWFGADLLIIVCSERKRQTSREGGTQSYGTRSSSPGRRISKERAARRLRDPSSTGRRGKRRCGNPGGVGRSRSCWHERSRPWCWFRSLLSDWPRPSRRARARPARPARVPRTPTAGAS